ncbi:ptk6 protein tyrosine kinase [Balamuthia mandrillaris]
MSLLIARDHEEKQEVQGARRTNMDGRAFPVALLLFVVLLTSGLAPASSLVLEPRQETCDGSGGCSGFETCQTCPSQCGTCEQGEDLSGLTLHFLPIAEEIQYKQFEANVELRDCDGVPLGLHNVPYQFANYAFKQGAGMLRDGSTVTLGNCPCNVIQSTATTMSCWLLSTSPFGLDSSSSPVYPFVSITLEYSGQAPPYASSRPMVYIPAFVGKEIPGTNATEEGPILHNGCTELVASYPKGTNPGTPTVIESITVLSGLHSWTNEMRTQFGFTVAAFVQNDSSVPLCSSIDTLQYLTWSIPDDSASDSHGDGATSSSSSGGGNERDNGDDDNTIIIIASVVPGVVVLIVLLVVAFLGVFFVTRRRRVSRKAVADIEMDGNDGGGPSGHYMEREPTGGGIVPARVKGGKTKKTSNDAFHIDYEELEFQDEIGSGAFGVVYKGMWRGQVAIKVLGQLSEKEFKDFKEESELMRKLRPHPNVVQLIGVCMNPDYPLCIVMEYMPRGCLLDYLRKGNELDEKRMVLMARDVAAGMLHLHSENIIHRDLASRNLLIGQEMSVKVSDFGRSREMQAEEGVQTTLTHVGPLKWMAPESLRHGIYSQKSDVWSYGVLLWEMTNEGKEPFADLNPVQCSIAICTEGLRLEVPSEAPQIIQDLMHRCFEEDPEERPSFKQIFKELTSCIKEKKFE